MGVTREWAITLGFSVLVLLALGLSLTWVNIERVDMAYELKRIQTEIDSQEALISKLEVERNTLMTPERLRVLAGQYGLVQARPGQIRRLSAMGEELPSPVIKSVPVPEKPQKAPKEPAKPSKKSKKDEAKPKGETKSDPKPETKADTKAAAKPETKAETKADAEARADARARAESKAEEAARSSSKSAKRTPVPFVPEPAKAPGEVRS